MAEMSALAFRSSSAAASGSGTVSGSVVAMAISPSR
jgi:hypothetical protein